MAVYIAPNATVVGENCVIGAGALVTGKMNAPAGSVLLGNPARVVKEATPEMIAGNAKSARFYMEIAAKTME